MRIEPYRTDGSGEDLRVKALHGVMERAGIGRPCPGCALVCPRCGGRSCRCNCRPDCAQAPAALSAEPEKFPVEHHIMPLVFALRDAALAVPHWSCEGHVDQNGDLWKLPRVWFYAEHVALADVVAVLLAHWRLKGVVRHAWHVVLIARDNDRDTSYSIEPDLAACEGEVDLGRLRADIRAMAGRMLPDAQRVVRERLGKITL